MPIRLKEGFTELQSFMLYIMVVNVGCIEVMLTQANVGLYFATLPNTIRYRDILRLIFVDVIRNDN